MSIIRISKSTYLSPGILTCFRKCSRKLNFPGEVSLTSYTVTEACEPKKEGEDECCLAKGNPVINTAHKSLTLMSLNLIDIVTTIHPVYSFFLNAHMNVDFFFDNCVGGVWDV